MKYYAFFNVWSFADDASKRAALVNARHSIPYHVGNDSQTAFDRGIAERFEVEGRIIIRPGEEIVLE